MSYTHTHPPCSTRYGNYNNLYCLFVWNVWLNSIPFGWCCGVFAPMDNWLELVFSISHWNVQWNLEKTKKKGKNKNRTVVNWEGQYRENMFQKRDDCFFKPTINDVITQKQHPHPLSCINRGYKIMRARQHFNTSLQSASQPASSI